MEMSSDESLNDDEHTAPTEQTLQVADDEIVEAQRRRKKVQKLLQAGVYNGMKVEQMYGLATIDTEHGKRVVLPTALWVLYWWLGLLREVNMWVRGCQECGSRKARPRSVISPLRSIRGGDVGDRWALDVAGPFLVANGGDRYVIATLEYVTRYAVAKCVTQHTAENVATFLMEEVVHKFGAFRELLTDSAPELVGKVIEQLVILLQASQINPVP
ncbi:unnamed protein product [Phytophthora fragariaefolia]|uniref:Unnamed protein product n=1 Tax=Phytophthora fragariaefolia TaxID=1490495 RepID=A0A9W6U9G4_9STRA|nr:unnamed protein product [Phytophthora fragariaefolia]